MKKLIVALLLFASAAQAQTTISALPAASALSGTEIIPVVQAGVTSRTTASAIANILTTTANSWGSTQTLPAGTVTAPPMVMQAGGMLTSPSKGAVEWDGSNLYVTQNSGPTRKTLAYGDLSNISWPASGASFSSGAASLALTTPNIGEAATVTSGAPASVQAYDALTQSVQYFTTAAANNWTLNLRGNSGTTLNSVLATGQALTVVVVSTQGATPFYNNALQVDGSAVTPKWQGGTAPAAGNASGLDIYTYTVIKTASATYTVLASLVQFK